MEIPTQSELPTTAQVDPDVIDYAMMPELVPSDDELVKRADASDNEDDTQKFTEKHSYSAVCKPAVYVDATSGQTVTRLVPGREYKMMQPKDNVPKDNVETVSLFTHVPGEEINVLPIAEEPEFLEVEWTADTGATVHVADKESLPFHTVRPSAGSRARQNVEAAGGKLIANEGEINVIMLPPMSRKE